MMSPPMNWWVAAAVRVRRAGESWPARDVKNALKDGGSVAAGGRGRDLLEESGLESAWKTRRRDCSPRLRDVAVWQPSVIRRRSHG